MHDTAFAIGRKFFEIYLSNGSAISEPTVIVEIGSMNINGSLRDVSPPYMTYLGIDVEHGPGVDLAIHPNEKLPLRADFADVVLSTSQMEHDPIFWGTFLELVRILKPEGTLYLSAPSNGKYHPFPQDYWRFYPDSGKALELWGRNNGYEITLLESFVAERMDDQWNDFVAVFKKSSVAKDDKIELLSDHFPSTNVRSFKFDGISRNREQPEDAVLIYEYATKLDASQRELERLNEEGARLREQLNKSTSEVERLTVELERAKSILEVYHDT